MIVESLNVNVLYIHFRYKIKWEEAEYGKAHKATWIITDIIDYAKVLLALLLLSVSFFQHRVLISSSGRHCTKGGATLNLEGVWLRNIVRL